MSLDFYFFVCFAKVCVAASVFIRSKFYIYASNENIVNRKIRTYLQLKRLTCQFFVHPIRYAEWGNSGEKWREEEEDVWWNDFYWQIQRLFVTFAHTFGRYGRPSLYSANIEIDEINNYLPTEIGHVVWMHRKWQWPKFRTIQLVNCLLQSSFKPRKPTKFKLAVEAKSHTHTPIEVWIILCIDRFGFRTNIEHSEF